MSSSNSFESMVAEKLETARSTGAYSFGCDAHRFALNAPLAAGLVEQAEQAHGFTLPDDYRRFLQGAGDGGAGPYYGIVPFAKALGDDPQRLQVAFAGLPPELEKAKPEPLTDYEQLRQGSVLLGTQGCAYEMRLVVQGEARGRVVYVDRENPDDFYFPPDATFADWYLRWLDLTLAGEIDDWFGFDNSAYPKAPASEWSMSSATASLAPPPEIEIPEDAPYRERLLRIRTTLTSRGQLNRHPRYLAPLSEEELQALEQRHGAKLCPDLRAFMKYVYAGGPGPYDGIEIFGFAGLDSKYSPARIDKPFPYTRQQVLEPRFQEVVMRDDVRPEGTIHIAHLRVSYEAFLVITGPERGRVFYLNCGIKKPRPYFVKDASFLDWFERWMMEGRDAWFGLDNPDYRLEKEPREFDMPVWHPVKGRQNSAVRR